MGELILLKDLVTFIEVESFALVFAFAFDCQSMIFNVFQFVHKRHVMEISDERAYGVKTSV